jgi:hypothetical protein
VPGRGRSYGRREMPDWLSIPRMGEYRVQYHNSVEPVARKADQGADDESPATQHTGKDAQHTEGPAPTDTADSAARWKRIELVHKRANETHISCLATKGGDHTAGRSATSVQRVACR